MVIHCFFEQGLEGNDFARHLLKVLLGQLIEKHAVPESVLYSVLPTIEAIDSDVSRNIFQQVFRDILKHVASHNRIILVLDTSTKDQWISTVVLDEITRANNSRRLSKFTKCVISGRECCDQSFNKEHVRNVSLNHELGVQGDVLRFAESRLTQAFRNDVSAPLSSLAKRIYLKGIGNFLWVALVIESINCVDAPATSGENFESLPSTIDGLYQRALDNISERNMGKFQKLLSWLLVARRPLQLNELSEALEMDPGSSILFKREDLPVELEEDQQAEYEILQWCSPLINITRRYTIEFRHHSVKEYLLSVSETKAWGISIPKAHQMLAETCLSLLTREDADSVHHSSPLKSCPFSSLWVYASMYWTSHYMSGELHSTTLFSVLHNFLLVTFYHDCKRFSLPEYRRPDKVASTTLRFAACHGITSLLQVSLEMGVSPNGDDCGECASPLALAVAGGHSKAVKILLQQQASIAAHNPRRSESLLHQAAFSGDFESVILLMENGAQTDLATGALKSTPLHAAASLGHLDILKLLMEQGADVNALIPMTGEAPLHLAASHGHFDIVKWLLEATEPSLREVELYDSMVQQCYHRSWMNAMIAEPVSNRRASWEIENSCYAKEEMYELQSVPRRYVAIESRTQEGRTPLHLAALYGHKRIVELLVSHGADVNAVDHRQYTALQLAVLRGHLAVVTFLLGIGADVRKGFHSCGPILKIAVENDHDTVAEVLAWHCFNLEVLGKPCQEPLSSLPLRSKSTAVRDAILRGFTCRNYRNRTRRSQNPPPPQQYKY